MSDADHPRESDVVQAIQSFPEDQAAALAGTREAIRALLPGGIETIAWGMPTVKVGPDQVLSYSGFAHHNSLFPGPGVAAVITEEFPQVTTTKGTVHFDRDKPVQLKLLRRIVALRLAEINESYPRANGKTRRYFTNGFTEYTGTIRDGQMHGSWEWFRRDGTIKRSGRFKSGEPIGEWTTYNTDGQPHRTTRKG